MDSESKTQTAAVDAFLKQDLLVEQQQTIQLDKKNNDRIVNECNLLENSKTEDSNNCLVPSENSIKQAVQEDSGNGLEKDEVIVGKNVLSISNEDEKKQGTLIAIVLKTTSNANDIQPIESEEKGNTPTKTGTEIKTTKKYETEDEIKANEDPGSEKLCATTDAVNHIQAETKENTFIDKKVNEKKEEVGEPMSVETCEILTEQQRMDIDTDDQQTMEVESKNPSPIIDDVEMVSEQSTNINSPIEVTDVRNAHKESETINELKSEDVPCTEKSFNENLKESNSMKVSNNTEEIIDISSSEDDILDNNSPAIDSKQSKTKANSKSPEKISSPEKTVHNKVIKALITKNIPDSTCTKKQIVTDIVSKIPDSDSPCKQESKSLKKSSDWTDNTISNKIETGEDIVKTGNDIKCNIDSENKVNGIINDSTEEDNNSNKNKCEVIASKITSVFDHTLINKNNHIYKVNITYELNDVKFLSIERISKNQMPSSNLKGPQNESSSNGDSLVLNVTSANNANDCQLSNKMHNFDNVESLCEFMINEFTTIKHLTQTESDSEKKLSTPECKSNQKTVYYEGETPSSTKSKRSRKRSVSEHDEESPKAKHVRRDLKETPQKDTDEKSSKAKLAKRDLKETPKKESEEEETRKPCVLAKWIDKKFYAGRVVGEKMGKFVIRFEDGAQKVLPKESIVFGDDDTLPLLNQSVYAHVDDDYENGTVTAVENADDKVVYTVKTPNKIVKVTATDLYLQDDQAKIIQKLNEEKFGEPMEDSSRSSRTKRQLVSPSTPEAGYSGGIGKRNKRQKRKPPKEVFCVSNSSTDDDDGIPQSKNFVKSTVSSPVRGIELIEGVQPELQKSFIDSELSKMVFISDYEKYQPECNVHELLGPMPTCKTMFRGKCFLLTCTVGLKPHRFASEENGYNEKFRQFSSVPFIKSYLQKQIEAAGGKIYQYFEDLPKGKYRQCKIIAPRPCLTAKYVQCLAANISAISHEWIVDSCRQNKVADIKNYSLPAGWSVLSEKFIKWKTGKASDQRLNSHPFEKSFILIAGIQDDFIEFWSRVCKLAGGQIRYIKTIGDITATTKGYMIAESDFSQQIRSKATFFGIPIISTFWVVQSLILGYICPPNCHPKLVEIYQDDEI